MPSVERTVTTHTTLPRVWDYLSDFTSTEEWDPPTQRTTRTSGDGGVGTTYHNVSSFLGSEQEVEYTVVERVEQERLVLTGDAGSVQLRDTLTFATTALEDGTTGTAVTYHAEFEPQGAAKLATPVLPAALKVLADKVASSLEERLERLS
ncbi:SRPBCC family protein [Nocardioides sp. Leaf374]|uniref:SRPBCC family protein n=1 Tax=Nocardioides sp. Leaf374 TaxID=2876560 RepID=UPI001E6063AA|nr:SRPBCC family protein [Nocardioides sp. Leaf374]